MQTAQRDGLGSPKTQSRIRFSLSLMGLLLVTSSLQAGPLSTLYLTTSNSGGYIRTIQGATDGGFAAYYNNNFELPIAVDGDVRTTGYNDGGTLGGQYTLAGAPTLTQYHLTATTPSNFYVFDATTDGTFNYMVDKNSKRVYRTDRSFGNPVLLFTNTLDLPFITYDPTNNSLWLGGEDHLVVQNYTLGGTLLSSFGTGHSNRALALDHADNTLWMVGTGNQLMQYSKAGVFLSGGPVVTNAHGGEFDLAVASQSAVPEPSSVALLGAGALLLVTQRRRLIRR